MSELTELFDVFFNGRPAKPISWIELIKRKKSMVRIDGKLYQVEVTELPDVDCLTGRKSHEQE